MKTKKLSADAQNRLGVYDQAEAVLTRLGIHKKETLPPIWKAFRLQTVQLLMDGYQERFIGLKLEELAKSRTLALVETLEGVK